ncbi:CD82 antigen [Bradysia coprophila]|uniref:CD82 antigen n=1 Tax=Bradysia coprophila TaxID=38358 RepID=UPI00187DB585|nr:CD82 antigen [Bradysia coprophila]
MGLSGCAKFVKYLLVIINIIFWIIGLAAVFAFIWIFSDRSIMWTVTPDQKSFNVGMCILCVGGIVMLIISILGCCGSLRGSHCMLMTFFCFLLLILVAQIAAGAWAIHNKSTLDDMFRATIKNTVQNEYGVNQENTDSFDTFQRYLECCGASGPNDWALSKYNSKDSSNVINMKISSSSTSYKIPESCCKSDIDADQCMLSTKVTLKSVINSDIHSQGCTDKLMNEVHAHMTLICGIICAVVVVEFFGLLFALILYCAVKNKENYKS